MHSLTLSFLSWVAERPRSYGDAMEAWRSSCPRLTIWEDALDAELVAVERGGERRVSLTQLGRALLDAKARAAGEPG
jgi:hypothetical protein